MTLFDTNVVSAFLRSDARTRTPILCGHVDAALTLGTAAISHFTHFELRRGLLELAERGQGRRQLIALTKLLQGIELLGLDGMGGAGWTLAAKLWADLRVHRPAIVLTDGDLLIAATAAIHGHVFATSEARLVENLQKVRFPGELVVIPVA